MAPLARSCLRLLLAYALAATAVGLFVYHRFPVGAVAGWSAVIAGFFLWLALAYLWAIPGQLRDWWRMRPGVPPRDGKRVAVIGPIHNSGATLRAPFSKTPCVAYLGTITNFAGEHPKKDYESFALAPSYIQTEQGQVKILAFPELDVPEEPVSGGEAKDAAAAYLASTTFLETVKAGFKGLRSEMKALAADDDGSIRYDYRTDPVADDLDTCRLAEKIVRAGDTVCATGIYSEERRGLVPDPDAIMHAITLRTGEPDSFRRRALRKALGSAFGFVLIGSLLTGAALLFLLNVPMDASEQMNPRRRFLWEEVKLERWIERTLRTPLVEGGTLIEPGLAMRQDLCENCASGRLEANQYVIDLKHASAWQNGQTRVVHLSAAPGAADGVTITFDKTTKPVSAAVGYPWTITITVNGKAFAVPKEWTIPQDVQHVHPSEVIDGRITVIDPNDAVRVRAAYKARMMEKP